MHMATDGIMLGIANGCELAEVTNGWRM